MMKQEVEVLFNKFLSIINDSERFCFITRNKEFQKESVDNLIELKKEVSNLKEENIKSNDENTSNFLLGIECVIDAMVNELNMWISLKNDEPNKAWDFLVDAQSNIREGLQSSETLTLNFEGYIHKLNLLEKLLFPKPMFSSPGIIIEGTKCSICNKDYEECNHLIGKAYMGKFCYRIVDKIKKVSEISIVENPANKHARINSFTENGITRDILTWKEIKEEEKKINKKSPNLNG